MYGPLELNLFRCLCVDGVLILVDWINWAVELWLMVVLKEIVEEDLQWKEAATEGKDKEVNGSSAD